MIGTYLRYDAEPLDKIYFSYWRKIIFKLILVTDQADGHDISSEIALR